ncbi:hypothetical protein FC17_GL000087 [Secundilactobacillus paracollinoides DSM 15502 = JCM 11969]|nr:hypothetical protein FC17_GL000087 [Secundilactobacillus paracollinoides DSM 15502 = JCM 11969]
MARDEANSISAKTFNPRLSLQGRAVERSDIIALFKSTKARHYNIKQRNFTGQIAFSRQKRPLSRDSGLTC